MRHRRHLRGGPGDTTSGAAAHAGKREKRPRAAVAPSRAPLHGPRHADDRPLPHVAARSGMAAPRPRQLPQRGRGARLGGQRPLAVGFGIATPAHVKSIGAIADGVIIGSAFVDATAGLTGARRLRPRALTLHPLRDGLGWA